MPSETPSGSPAGYRPFHDAAPPAPPPESPGDWPRPLPLVGQFERLDYPLEALPAAIRGAVEETQDAVQAPVEMVASSALAVASAAAQHLLDVRRNASLSGPCALYFLTVAESGDRKSTVDRLLGRALRDFEAAQREAAKPALAQHEADLAAWTARHDTVEARLTSDAKQDKSLDGHRASLARLAAEKPEPPRVPRLLHEDVTAERLGKGLATEWPSAAILSSEGGAVLGGHSMGRDSLTRTLSLLNKLWDGAPHIVDRATTSSFAVRNARMTMSLQVQPAVLADFLDHDRGLSRGSGFLARYLIASPASLQGRRFYREPGALPELQSFSARIAEMLAELPRIDGERGMILPALDLSPEAKAAWTAAYDAIEGELATEGDFASVRDAASKAADNVARLAAVLHAFDLGARGPIGAASVGSAVRIVTWHLYAARTVLAPFTMTKEAADAATLDGWLIDRCRMEGVDGFATRAVLNGGPARLRNRSEFAKAAAVLARHGRARIVTEGQRKSIRVNPALLDGAAVCDDPAPGPSAPLPRWT
ncbi:MAG: YfjI family protein [Reyranellaceae bacterium]